MKPLDVVKLWLRRLTRAAAKWWRRKHADEAAALAFYSLISLVPILLVGVNIASVFVDEETATRILVTEADRVAGSTVGGYFAQILQTDIRWVGTGISPYVGGLLLFFAATKVIAELRKSLGKVFGKRRRRGRKAAVAGLVGRLAAMGMLLVLGVFIASAVIFETMMGVIVGSLNDSPFLLRMATAVAPLLSFGAMVFLAAVAMRWLPARRPKFSEALAGGVVSALLLVGLKIALAQFLKHTDVGSFYGSALTLVLVLFWIYFAMQAFLYGAELAAELAVERRMREPVEAEVPVAKPTKTRRLSDAEAEDQPEPDPVEVAVEAPKVEDVPESPEKVEPDPLPDATDEGGKPAGDEKELST